jgi:hypothetical protein
MRTFYAEIEIDAPAEAVWSQVIDLAGYGEWHAIIPSIRGEPHEGALLEMRVSGVERPLRGKVLRLDPGRELSLLALWPLGLVRPVHTQRVEPSDAGRTRYVCQETFRGLLVPFLASALERNVGPLYQTTCEGLKAYVEQAQSV